MSPQDPQPLKELETLVLATLVHLGASDHAAYGVAVRRDLEQRAGRDVSIGAIYATLRRLESRGLVSSTLGEATAARGGRAKRIFKIAAAGAQALAHSRVALLKVLEDLPERLV